MTRHIRPVVTRQSLPGGFRELRSPNGMTRSEKRPGINHDNGNYLTIATSGCQPIATRSISRIVRKNNTEKHEPQSTVA